MSLSTRTIVGVVVFVAAYVASILLYVNGGSGQLHQMSSGAGDGTKVTFDIEAIQSNNGILAANITVMPAPELLDPQTGTLNDDLHIVANSLVQSSKRTWPKGSLPDPLRVSISLTGDVADWPFDRYETGPLKVHLFSGASQTPQKVTVTLVDRLLGWEVDVVRQHQGEGHAPYGLQLHRSQSTMAFAVLILGVLIALAVLAFFVAIQTVRNRRKFQPPMTTWYAAMLFAVMPLRDALPDSPPFGSWVDVTVVLWVIVVLTISLVLYISCWWRHLAPDHEK
ncbi:DUF4436 domain-containing protein [Mycobacterium intermedium]|uniref:DUF4436 domain-containing protein n=1 Tax=Mycobacterium intermedium TaxID=28445 RepID=A0A1E3SLF3_MYCIE|nr:DUF4436 domain-containing protein [Mycobacterium intermedium]MCV6963460.1 DUF4436 domain-containing protein [Mycobacterium intermedium]ODR02966.1 DUF4436 domain-containing protein [Mycobacterium intermedium]OPE49946.1 DUF4436 domain-containing protein [Mycobacterium intermedium]ORB02799.1 DUF4436 domain-containing protein [Mycobacterium intermedium]